MHIFRPTVKATATRSKKGLMSMRAKAAARRKAIVEQAEAEILGVYKPKWVNVPAEKRTRHGIALWLLRERHVTAFGNEESIVKVLESLAKRRKIWLPKKTTQGGARRMKGVSKRKH